MNHVLIFRPCLMAAIMLLAAGLPAQSAHDATRKGDRLYDGNNFGEAAQRYKEGLSLSPNDPKLTYNYGSALYMEGKHEEARKALEHALPNVSDPIEKADVLHNLGNTYMHLDKYKEAVEAYQNSLRLRPGDTGTKTNLQLAKKKLREQQQKEKEQKQQQDNKDQQQDNKDQQQQDNKNQPQQNQQDNKNQQNNKNQQQQQQNQQNNKDQQQQNGKMSKQEVQKFLETAISREDQKTARKYREMQKPSRSKSPKKDW
jgi:tetratricopeptide (TPR) repeat protein